MTRVRESFRPEFQPLLDRVKNSAASRMNSPKIDGVDIRALCDLSSRSSQPSTQFDWNFARKVHVEALFADAPGNQWTSVWQNDREKVVDGETNWFRTDQIGCAAIGKDEECEQLFEILRFLHVKRAQLQAHEEHFGPRLGAHDVTRGFECVDGGVAAHKADESAFDGWI